jgi:alpha-beta hydrolase superfamily lysophospholipase
MKELFMKIEYLLFTMLFFHTVSATSVNYLFCHGVGGNEDQVKYYQHYEVLPAEAKSFNFNDWHDGVFDQAKTSLGQKADIEVVNCNYNLLRAEISPIVIYGVSRGAATVVNFAGMEKSSNVAALVLESPFADIYDVFRHVVPCASLLPKDFILRLQYPSYNPKGEQPINYINAIPSDIPIALVCSKKDTLIPYESTIKLYNKLVESGRKNVHLLVLEQGSHANLLGQREYIYFIHAFFKQYNLPYNEELAVQSNFIFSSK